MDFKSCTHKDVRQIDNLRCCMSCGETLYLQTQPRTSSSVKASWPSRQDDISQGLLHTYGDLRLSTGNAIRIVVLLPGDVHDPILCTIAIVELDSARYDAVSYTRATEDSDDKKTGRIHLPDGVIPVTENCEAALRQFRLRSAPRQLWIDTICIDQSNTRERNHQVEQMDQIYRSAATVHICISDPDRTYTQCMHWLNSGPELIFWPKTDYTSAAITQLNELFRRRYFSRVWVIQELHLARDIVLHVNSDAVPHFAHVLTKLRKFLDVPQLLQNIQDTPRRRGIIDCLRMSLSASSSDPRDKVFAILSLLDPPIRKYVTVDYALEHSHILGVAVMLSISEAKDLQLLPFARLPVTTNSTTACSFGIQEFLNFLQNEHRGQGWVWESSLFPDKPKSVVVKMASKETQHVEYVNCSLPLIPEDDFTIVEQTSQWYPAQQILPRIKVPASMIDISLGTLKDGNVPLSDLVTHQAGNDFAEYAWLKNMFQKPPSESMRVSKQHELPSHFNWEDLTQCISEVAKYNEKDITKRGSGAKDISNTAGSHAQYVSGPFLFRTHYSVGSSSSCHMMGDHVVAIMGVPEHFLIRPIGSNTYRIVGTCYLWAAQTLDYWNPGIYKGLWQERPVNLGAKSRTIEVY